jgi:hypothetical protein
MGHGWIVEVSVTPGAGTGFTDLIPGGREVVSNLLVHLVHVLLLVGLCVWGGHVDVSSGQVTGPESSDKREKNESVKTERGGHVTPVYRQRRKYLTTV